MDSAETADRGRRCVASHDEHRSGGPRGAHHEEATRGAQLLRLADQITAFAGSLNFIWIHVAFFAIWMLFLEPSPWPTLTLAVSLEAIFLSTFVLIGQNGQAAFQQAKADHDFHTQELELRTNTELTRARSTYSQRSCTATFSANLRPTTILHRQVTPQGCGQKT